MKDIRVSVRMTKEEHEQLKILVIKKNTTINAFLLEYIQREIRKDENDEEQ